VTAAAQCESSLFFANFRRLILKEPLPVNAGGQLVLQQKNIMPCDPRA
jgi:hypothetical protein